jgi:hypothetical protein
MLAFTAAARRAADDSVALGSADFEAIERWASLLDRRGHWAEGAIPPAGEERVRYLGTLAWYGIEPPAPEADRVWVGSRMLVQVGDAEGFVTDEIPATGVGCPVAWRPRLAETSANVAEVAGAWFADRPEFVALATLGGRVFVRAAGAGRKLAAYWHQRSTARAPLASRRPSNAAVVASTRAPAVTAAPPESGAASRRTHPGSDSAPAGLGARPARDALGRADSLTRDSARIGAAESAGAPK